MLDGITILKIKEKPKQVELTEEQFQDLQFKINNSNLDNIDKSLVTESLSSFVWLKEQLENSKITIAQLKQLFGIKTEKKSPQEMQMMANILNQLQSTKN